MAMFCSDAMAARKKVDDEETNVTGFEALKVNINILFSSLIPF